MGRPEAILQLLIEGGEAAVDEFIRQRASEELYLDFKRSATAGARLADDDRKNLAKAISGFGNTAGGVIVWGVDCRNQGADGDVARAKFPVPNATGFRSWLEARVSGATLPSHKGVEHRVISEGKDGTGLVATLVPTADNAPLQVPGEFRYYMRVGSSFEPIPHAILATMFGRRPAPELEIHSAFQENAMKSNDFMKALCHVTVSNAGLGIATDCYVTVREVSIPSGVSFYAHDKADSLFEGTTRGPGIVSRMSRRGARLPPGAHFNGYVLELNLPRRLDGSLELEIAAGCSNGAAAYLRLTQSREKLAHSVQVFWSRLDENYNLPPELGSWLARRAFGMTQD